MGAVNARSIGDLTFTSGDITYNLVPFIILIILFFAIRLFTLVGFGDLGDSFGDLTGSGYGAPSSSYGTPSSSYGLKTSQDLYYLHPGTFTQVDENFGNIDLSQTQNEYLTRLLNVNNHATSQGKYANLNGNIAGVNVQYPSSNPYMAA